jgi:hypothetical protein
MIQSFKKNRNPSLRFTLSVIVALLLGTTLSAVVYAADCDFCVKSGGLGCPPPAPPPPPEPRPCPTCALP